MRRICGIQRVLHHATLLGAHISGGRVYHVRQEDKSDGSHAVPQAAGVVPRDQINTSGHGDARHTDCMPCLTHGKGVHRTSQQVCHHAGECRTGPVHVHALPWMGPTDNESERMLRKAMIHRKIRQKLAAIVGKIMFGTTMTCLLTWDELGLNWFEKLSEVFWTT